MAPLPLQNPDVPKNRQGGICHFLNLQEDNVRFILLAVLIYIYLAMGAFIFQAVEESGEDKLRKDFHNLYEEYIRNFTNLYYPFNTLPPWVLKERKFNFGDGVRNGDEEVESDGNVEFMENLSVEEDVGNEPFLATLDGLHELLFAYGNATQAGMVWKRKRWDWFGSFFFSWTLVSTVGYGATTPTTTLGKLLIIPYGFFGCAGGLLFFNLFLERIITFLATCMRKYRRRRQKRRPCIDSDFAEKQRPDPRNATGSAAIQAVTISVVAAQRERGTSPSRSSTGEESTVEKADWKPSVYWVLLCLFIMSVIIIGVSGAVFQKMEGWTYWEAVYFSFVSYATIGLGDLVSLQQQSYGQLEMVYRLLAFALMILGSCSIYSLLNVMSIIVKQLLNYIIKKMDYCGDCCCCNYCRRSAVKVRRRMSSKKRRPRRSVRKGPGDRCRISVLRSGSARAIALGHHNDASGSPDCDMNSEGGGLGGSRFDLDERRCSGENMISIRGELNNKNLIVMQKLLYETAQMSRHSAAYECPGFSATSVIPLAIVTEKLGDNPV